MKTVKEMLLEEKRELEMIKEKVRKNLQNAPEGFLRIKRKRGGLEFYYKENDVRANVYNKTGELRRKIIKPWKVLDQEYADMWQNVSYEGKALGEEIAAIYTERGEKCVPNQKRLLRTNFMQCRFHIVMNIQLS